MSDGNNNNDNNKSVTHVLAIIIDQRRVRDEGIV